MKSAFWKRILSAFCAFSLAGCAEFAAFKSGVAEHGADAADQLLDAALWQMCSASPVGAIKRRFKSEEERRAYNTLCPESTLP